MAMQYGVGFGGQGAWFNKHFATLQEAQAFYSETIMRTIDSFSNFKTQITETAKGTTQDMQCFVIVNVKKDGSNGKIKQTVRLYQVQA
jgi:hypothetical protein